MAQGLDLQNLSSNWKKLQATLPKKDSTRKRTVSDEAPHRNDNRTKRLKSKHVGRAVTSENGTKENKSSSMGNAESRVGDEKPSASLALWAEDNHISPKDLAAAYGTSLKSTVIPDPGNDREKINEGHSKDTEAGRYIAIDCEMVGVGPSPDKESALARVSIVNYHGHQLYDSFVQPKESVTDYRTFVSGVTPELLQTARTLEQVQEDVAKLLDGKILIGHALRNDLDALLLGHPKRDIRDTSKLSVFRQVSNGRTPSLKRLAKELLHVDIQGGEHSSVEDARATMLLFRREKSAFEREHIAKWGSDWKTGSDGKPLQAKSKKKKKKAKSKITRGY